jgi:hypothetical protein
MGGFMALLRSQLAMSPDVRLSGISGLELAHENSHYWITSSVAVAGRASIVK